MAGTRFGTVLNGETLIGFRHFYSGVLSDAFQLFDVKVLNPEYQVVHVIPASQIQRVDVGSYQAIIPSGILSSYGMYHDSWNLKSTQDAVNRSFVFDIQVGLDQGQTSQNTQVDWNNVLEKPLSDLDACMLKKIFLWPVWSVLSNGYYLPDCQLQYNIDSAISWAVRTLGMPLRRTRVRTKPFSYGSGNLILGQDYEQEGKLLPWSAVDAQAWSQIKLPNTGVHKIVNVRGIYGGQVVYDIPSEWVRNNFNSNGYVYIRPTTAGTIANIVDGTGRFLDVTLLEAVGANMVPGFWAVDYDYGPENDKIPIEIANLIMKKAAIDVLDQLGMSITRGLSSRSASVDGLSSSINTVASAERSMFGALVATYQRDMEPTNLNQMRLYYKGPSITIV